MDDQMAKEGGKARWALFAWFKKKGGGVRVGFNNRAKYLAFQKECDEKEALERIEANIRFQAEAEIDAEKGASRMKPILEALMIEREVQDEEAAHKHNSESATNKQQMEKEGKGRWALFAWTGYQARGGFDDLHAIFDTYEEALKVARGVLIGGGNDDLGQIVELDSMKMVFLPDAFDGTWVPMTKEEMEIERDNRWKIYLQEQTAKKELALVAEREKEKQRVEANITFRTQADSDATLGALRMKTLLDGLLKQREAQDEEARRVVDGQ